MFTFTVGVMPTTLYQNNIDVHNVVVFTLHNMLLHLVTDELVNYQLLHLILHS